MVGVISKSNFEKAYIYILKFYFYCSKVYVVKYVCLCLCLGMLNISAGVEEAKSLPLAAEVTGGCESCGM